MTPEHAKLREAVVAAIMAYEAPGSPETFRRTKDACAALRAFEASLGTCAKCGRAVGAYFALCVSCM